MVDDAPPYERQRDSLKVLVRNGLGSFTEHEKWVKAQHTKANPFSETANNSWLTNSDPLRLLTRDMPRPALYQDIMTCDMATGMRAALRNVSPCNPLDDSLMLALRPSITMEWYLQNTISGNLTALAMEERARSDAALESMDVNGLVGFDNVVSGAPKATTCTK